MASATGPAGRFWHTDERSTILAGVGVPTPFRMLALEALRVAGHGERKAEETGLRLRLRGVRTDGLDEAWA